MMKKQEQASLQQEKLSSLIHLASYMMGRLNVCDGKVTDCEEIQTEYPHWIEQLLDTAAGLASEQNSAIDELITGFDK